MSPTQTAAHANPLHTSSYKGSVTGLLRWHQARPWQTNAALILLGTCLLLLTRQLVSEYDHFTLGFSGVSGWSAWLYIAAVFLILTQPVNRYTLPIILAFAIACRLVPLFAEPYLSSDIYRYVWDGIVQHAHISPYRYVPGDPALTFLRAPNADIFDNINRRDYAHTIYPPAAQLLFYCITFISPTVVAMKSAMLLFEALTTYTLIQILHHLGLRREQALLYTWCPLLFWEVAGSGHLDAAAMAFITLALLARLRRQPILTGLFLGMAVATKLYPIVLLPTLLIRSKNADVPRPASATSISNITQLLNPGNWDWKLPTATFALVALGYAAYSSVGLLVFGFLGGYVQEEGLATGTRYFFLDLAQHIPGLHNLPSAAFYLLCALTFGILTLWYLQTALAENPLHPEPQILKPVFALAIALMLFFSPHYPWYILWLIPFFTLQPNLPILAYLMGVFYLFTTPLADGTLSHTYTLNKILYGGLLLATLIYFILRHRSLPGIFFHQPDNQRPA